LDLIARIGIAGGELQGIGCFSIAVSGIEIAPGIFNRQAFSIVIKGRVGTG